MTGPMSAGQEETANVGRSDGAVCLARTSTGHAMTPTDSVEDDGANRRQNEACAACAEECQDCRTERERDRYHEALEAIKKGVDDNDLVLGIGLLRGIAREALEVS